MDNDSCDSYGGGYLPSLLTPREAAEALKLKPHTLAVWRCATPERLPFVKVGNRVRYRQRDVAQLIEAGT